ncbi:MAG TPA: hypothetical protein VE422_11505 [Terriglobia bacterium]|nr:hypothetical protein [Terriglobia bacterium]
MQRFDIGDPIVILPRFADLYPIHWGTVIDMKLDPFRPAFTEYTIQFPDGSTTNLFEFQILEAEPNCETFLAAFVLDSYLFSQLGSGIAPIRSVQDPYPAFTDVAVDPEANLLAITTKINSAYGPTTEISPVTPWPIPGL